MRKNFRLSNTCVQNIKSRNKERYVTETQFIEAAIAAFSIMQEESELLKRVEDLEKRMDELEGAGNQNIIKKMGEDEFCIE